MKDAKFKKKYPHLTQFLEFKRRDVLAEKIMLVKGLGCLVTGLAAPLVGLIVGTFVGTTFDNWSLATIFVILGATVTVACGYFLTKRFLKPLHKPDSNEERRRRHMQAVVNSFHHLDNQSKLFHGLDPVAAQLLEVGAYHWNRINASLTGAAWSSEALEGHWQMLKERSAEAAKFAMADLMIMASDCVGEPAKQRKDDLKQVFQDFAGLDIRLAFKGLSDMATTDSETYCFHSERTKEIYAPCQKVIESLRELADLVEQNAITIRAESTHLPNGSYASESIEILVNEFKAVKQAEEELHQKSELY